MPIWGRSHCAGQTLAPCQGQASPTSLSYEAREKGIEGQLMHLAAADAKGTPFSIRKDFE